MVLRGSGLSRHPFSAKPLFSICKAVFCVTALLYLLMFDFCRTSVPDDKCRLDWYPCMVPASGTCRVLLSIAPPASGSLYHLPSSYSMLFYFRRTGSFSCARFSVFLSWLTARVFPQQLILGAELHLVMSLTLFRLLRYCIISFLISDEQFCQVIE